MSSKVLYDVKGPKSLFEMTWAEVSDALKKTDIVIVPVGSTEQHGPHLPLGSDSIQATDMSRMVVEKLGREGVTVVAAPTIPFGVSYHHMKFPGTISISSSLLSALIKEICKSLHAHGFRRFVLLLAHGGNFQTLKLVAQDLVLELPGASFLVPDWLPIMGAKYPEILRSDRPRDEHHSGEGETARMLASTPSLVMLEKAKAFYTDEKNDPYRRRPYTGSGGLEGGIWDMKDITPVGSMGNPLLATKETGEKLYGIVVDWLCQVIKAEFTIKK
jgi:creatinine amidohydrolase